MTHVCAVFLPTLCYDLLTGSNPGGVRVKIKGVTMRITQEIQRAMTKYMENEGVKRQDLAGIMGVTPAAISKMLTNAEYRTKVLKPDHWDQLQPLIAPYLDSALVAEQQETLSDIERMVVEWMRGMESGEVLDLVAHMNKAKK